jgi:Amt family ammonium transporter
VVGLVAITPAAGFVSYGPAIAIGILASGVSFGAVILKNKTTLDDTLDVFPCHGVGGITGMLATALFAEKGGLFTGGGPALLGYHLLTLLVVGIFSFGGSWLLYWATNLVVPIRVNAENETHGLDTSQHGEAMLAA